ncbi:MAG: hypothetical protein P4L22_06270 [Candidatus Babeliales bacterium]|nr:hypothetical protein [Candidatus Babeliales bacterium]
MLNKLKLFFLIIFAQSANAMVVDKALSKFVNSTNQASVLSKTIIGSKLEIIQPVKTLSNQIVAAAKNVMPNAMTSLCSVFNNPYVLLIKSQALALTYIIYVNSCDHQTNLISSIFSPDAVGKFIQSAAPYLIEGCVYAAGEAAYKKSNAVVQKRAGAGAVALICLDFVCQDCYKAKLPEAAKTLLTAVATSGTLDLIQNKVEKKKEDIKSFVKKPIVIGTLITAGLLTCTYLYNSFDTENIPTLIPSIITMVEQSLFYNCAYKFSKQILSKK